MLIGIYCLLVGHMFLPLLSGTTFHVWQKKWSVHRSTVDKFHGILLQSLPVVCSAPSLPAPTLIRISQASLQWDNFSHSSNPLTSIHNPLLLQLPPPCSSPVTDTIVYGDIFQLHFFLSSMFWYCWWQ